MTKTRIIFIGCESFAEAGLLALLNSDYSNRIEIVGILTLTAPNRENTLLKLAKLLSIQTQNLSIGDKITSEIIHWIDCLSPHLGIMMQFPLWLPPSMSAKFTQGIINVHPSDLPRFRGGRPIEATMLAGEPLVISAHLVNEKFDAGAIIQKTKPVLINDLSFDEVYKIASCNAAMLLVSVVIALLNNQLTVTEQKNDAASYFSNHDYLMRLNIDWKKSVVEIHRCFLTRSTSKGIVIQCFSDDVTEVVEIKVFETAYLKINTAEMKLGQCCQLQEDGYLSFTCRDGLLLLKNIKVLNNPKNFYHLIKQKKNSNTIAGENMKTGIIALGASCASRTRSPSLNINLINRTDHLRWNIFIDMSVGYIQHYWSETFKDKTVADSQREYESALIERIAQGPRGLFLAEYNAPDSPIFVGLANAYIDEHVLHIAEFYVKEDYQRKGVGSALLEQIKIWGKEHGAHLLEIEVDQNLELANKYWNSFGFDLSENNGRNVYSSVLELQNEYKG